MLLYFMAIRSTSGHTNLPKKSIAEPVYDKQRDRWRVSIPSSLSENNRRVRSWHGTREAARACIAGVARWEEPAAVISPMLAMKADEARAILEPYGLDLIEAARAVAHALKTLDGAGTIQQAAKEYRDAHDTRHASNPLGESVALYLKSREDLSDSTLKSYKYSLDRVLAPLRGRMMADIKSTDLKEILKDKGAAARAMHLRNIRTFWKWAGSPIRSWASMATVDALEASRVSNDADIEILEPDDVRALLEAAELEGPAAAAAYAIAVFGGVRMAELEKLT